MKLVCLLLLTVPGVLGLRGASQEGRQCSDLACTKQHKTMGGNEHDASVPENPEVSPSEGEVRAGSQIRHQQSSSSHLNLWLTLLIAALAAALLS